MRTLTLLRHAKSSWKETGLADRDRPLNKRGETDAPEMARRIAEAGIRPSLILTSPAQRTWKTARAVARELGYPLEFLQRDERLYLASSGAIAAVLAEQDAGFHSILLVGHNPGLTEFANRLIPGLTRNIPTGGVVSFDFDCSDWNVAAAGEPNLRYHDFPKNMRVSSA
ncbi:MAG: histidine phosphatase family protein [Gammaproteobacteria bacterium]|nr:histidine phosphatase family protein [Gammaproteobacteria bacterium]MDH4256260.1 histidine phosphatase family protein [Gammaproteobacteria bacterium]MDH5310703.1 histidine phosphatase family protein [Gammaproteobacteria bacterium]